MLEKLPCSVERVTLGTESGVSIAAGRGRCVLRQTELAYTAVTSSNVDCTQPDPGPPIPLKV